MSWVAMVSASAAPTSAAQLLEYAFMPAMVDEAVAIVEGCRARDQLLDSSAKAAARAARKCAF